MSYIPRKIHRFLLCQKVFLLCISLIFLMSGCDDPTEPQPDASTDADTAEDALNPDSTPDGDLDSTPEADEDLIPTERVTISGIAFSFINMTVPIVEAEVSLAEYPSISTVTDENGYYELQAPDQSQATIFVVKNGYAPMHIQTFSTNGEDIEDVKLQMIPNMVYNAFAGALKTEPDDTRCQISTTVNEIAIQGMTIDEMAAHGHHGVAGATVDSSPQIPLENGPIYFNSSTIPDRSVTETTIDGGVVYFNVPPGVYTITATHPSQNFHPFVATCEAGRFINAGPPWGLREF